ncbi:hypothetical protein JG677_08055 [Campylobacter sp. TTU-622]|nr:hypothetical protein [Campylobacter sp. TTU-622]
MLNIFTTIVKDKVKSLAIGSFDGIHLGHKKLIDCLDKLYSNNINLFLKNNHTVSLKRLIIFTICKNLI